MSATVKSPVKHSPGVCTLQRIHLPGDIVLSARTGSGLPKIFLNAGHGLLGRGHYGLAHPDPGDKKDQGEQRDPDNDGFPEALRMVAAENIAEENEPQDPPYGEDKVRFLFH